MSTWLSLVPPLAVGIGLLALLGLPATFALKLRGFAIAIVALPVAFSVLALTPILAALFKLPWGPLVPVAVSFLLALVLLPCRRWLGANASGSARPHRLSTPILSAALGGAAIAVTLVMSMKTADAISQTYDANFHLNSVRQILETGNAAPFALDLSAPGQSVFYPAVWHGFVALIAQVSGASIPLSTNAALFIACSVVWPVGVVALGRAVAGPSRRVSVVAGIAAAAFPSFPLALAGYGVLYPNLLSTCLLPFVLVAGLQLLDLGFARRSDPLRPALRYLLFLGALGAAILAHPNALHVILLWGVFPVGAALVRYVKGQPGGTSRKIISIVMLVLYSGLLLLAWVAGRTGDNPWEGQRSPLGALVDVFGSTPRLEGHSWGVTILICIGVALTWRKPGGRWMLGSAAILAIAFVIAFGFPSSDWRTLLLSPWYSDPWRLASLVPLGAVPLLTIGGSAVVAIARVGALRFTRMEQDTASHGTNVFAAVVILSLLAVTQGAGAFAGVQYVSTKYEFSDTSPLLSPDERQLIERLPDSVPEGEVLINNPWNGGALAYAIAGYEVLVPHTGGTYDPRITEMTSALATGTPEACRLTRELDVRYLLDFGDQYVFEDTPRAEPFEGISAIEESSVLTEVDHEGPAKLYEVTGC
ncbi:hypothetical protein GCM10009847_01870 [Leucobacter tardus]|uniref:Uncharacterized protein n=1 Tax=Leucobacter tardus TaxID=501483 RepID=A0A939QC52_9MICO|nr:DUF6541 family protein [Leucobacter tardus]MBO2988398.1 hypothetical protein [Leucobacter tardus]